MTRTVKNTNTLSEQIHVEPYSLSVYSDSYPEDFLYRRERLPSIVVDPTEVSELESGELRWPPRCCMGGEQEDEEDSSGVQTEGDGEQQEDTGMEEG
uniref:LBH domain-containing protein n=1 Tax=Sphaeramia orbicularis TaxID=375764 RepID=A0A673B342_9TELE